MFRQKPPWWMHLVTACYLASAAVVVYVDFRGPELPGVELTSLLTPGPAVVVRIAPGSPADRAGIKPGDRLVSFEARSVRSALDWAYALGEAEAGRPVRVGLERGGEHQQVVLTLRQRSGLPLTAQDWVRLARALLAFSLALVIAYTRPFDLQARLGALLLAEVLMLSPGVPVEKMESFFFPPAIFISLNLLSAAFPISIAYAILRHRAFDISVVIRQGLKYAVARRTVVAGLPVLVAVLVTDLLVHGEQPLGAILRERGWIYAVLGCVALLAQRHQRAWIEALDRRFSGGAMTHSGSSAR